MKTKLALIRDTLENLFGEKFTTGKFLKDKSESKTLQLDFYNEKLGIAVEYDGEAFDHEIPVEHKAMALLKEKLCLEHNVKLVRISYIDLKDKSESEISECIRRYFL